MTADRVERCRRCGERDAAAPDGFAVFVSRNLFGPRVERDLCQRCFRRGLWAKWRILVLAASFAFAAYNMWGGRWVEAGVACAVSAIWWMISSRALAAIRDEVERPGC